MTPTPQDREKARRWVSARPWKEYSTPWVRNDLGHDVPLEDIEHTLGRIDAGNTFAVTETAMRPSRRCTTEKAVLSRTRQPLESSTSCPAGVRKVRPRRPVRPRSRSVWRTRTVTSSSPRAKRTAIAPWNAPRTLPRDAIRRQPQPASACVHLQGALRPPVREVIGQTRRDRGAPPNAAEYREKPASGGREIGRSAAHHVRTGRAPAPLGQRSRESKPNNRWHAFTKSSNDGSWCGPCATHQL